MNGPSVPELLRAAVFHTPRNPFTDVGALECHGDGGLLIREGRVAACGDYARVRAEHPEAAVRDLRGGFLLPGLVDTHTHFPQLRVLGNLGHSLLDWLDRCALPEEARMADVAYARAVAAGFVDALAAHGTTTALVFGAHFAEATGMLFEAAESAGLRVISGLVLSDRRLRSDLEQRPEDAYRDSSRLIRCFHGRGRLLYAVTPRFALSSSEAMLEVCQTLLRETPGLRMQTHLNESAGEIGEVKRLFPWAEDYLAVYERFGLVRAGAVLAHDVHPTDSELARLAHGGGAVAHCPSSNAALGSGIFPMRRHLDADVPFALGTDAGAGAGLGILREAVQAYLMQRVAAQPMKLGPGHLLYLATRAGAEALGLEDQIGDFEPGKFADFVYFRPPEGSPLGGILQQERSPEEFLGAALVLAGPECIREVRVEDSVVYAAAPRQ